MHSVNFINKPINLSIIPGFNDLINSVNNCESNILKLNKTECLTNNNQKYKIVRYDKNFLTTDMISTYGLCRSVILNSNNDVVCYSPPKSVPYEVFVSKYPNKTESIVAEEFIEGTMINVFWDPTIELSGAWQISTRNNVGATSSFYKTKNNISFKDMFLETARYINFDINRLNRNYCYSFVMQHPNNRIVVPFQHPVLYLVAVYSINTNKLENNITVYSHSLDEVKEHFKNDFYWDRPCIKFPEIYKWNNYKELTDNYASMNTPYFVLGVVIHNLETGERTKIRNPVYEQVRKLKGNQPKLQYQYLCLRKEGKVGDFLKYFPENKKEFSEFRDQLHSFTITLYDNYISCYIKKEKPLIQFSEQYRTHMFNLHQIYINQSKEKKFYISNMEVIKYVNNLHPSLLMYCLNHNLRKRNVDFIKVDNIM